MGISMNDNISLTIFVIAVIVWIVGVYSQTKKIESPLKERIRDICLIGIILLAVDPISNYFMKEHSFVLAGVIIYVYGLLLLLANEFRKGEKESE
jgi:Na+/melibiose symporter-like transporter